MARREQYNPLLKSYPDSVKINAVGLGAETLYTRLIVASDDAGRYYGDAGMVLGKLFTARMVAGEVSRDDVQKWLNELEAVALIKRYVVNNVTYLEIVNVFRTLRKDKTPQILYPARLPETVTDPLRNRDDTVTVPSENVALDVDVDVDVDPYQNVSNGFGPDTHACMIPIPPSLNVPPFLASWGRWLEHLRQKGNRPSQLTLTDQLMELERAGPEAAIGKINYSIRQGYVGLHEAGGNYGKPKIDRERHRI